ncbi:MAG TPA: hypothetical protein VNH18_01245 [Bryobacteraceae bacterium]|nr:hypothetical protein [Bryobacteraceae bacterium]
MEELAPLSADDSSGAHDDKTQSVMASVQQRIDPILRSLYNEMSFPGGAPLISPGGHRKKAFEDRDVRTSSRFRLTVQRDG